MVSCCERYNLVLLELLSLLGKCDTAYELRSEDLKLRNQLPKAEQTWEATRAAGADTLCESLKCSGPRDTVCR